MGAFTWLAAGTNRLSATEIVADSGADSRLGQVTSVSASQVFTLAAQASERGDFAVAEKAYRALIQDRDIEIRTEARFRLAMMLADSQHRYADAAVEFRRILDDKPDAARVRLELARMQAMLGDLASARRELRAAEASGLPAEVEQLVRFYSQALRAQRPFGGSIEVALAPDSNINRATRSNTLGTVIGDFTLDKNAQARSGVGLALKGQGYLRLPVRSDIDMLVRASSNALLYRQSDFNDISVGLQAGPQIRSGRDRLSLTAGPTWRWYGPDPYSFAVGGEANWQHPTGKRGQVQLGGALSRVTNKRNPLQTATDYSLSFGADRAFTGRFGGGAQLFGFREVARDPGYSLASGGLSTYLFREVGRTTFVGTVGYSHLESDARLLLYPRRRIEDRYSASLAATLRLLRLGRFAPLARVRWERNRSSIEIYDYRRIATEIGVTTAF